MGTVTAKQRPLGNTNVGFKAKKFNHLSLEIDLRQSFISQKALSTAS